MLSATGLTRDFQANPDCKPVLPKAVHRRHPNGCRGSNVAGGPFTVGEFIDQTVFVGLKGPIQQWPKGLHPEEPQPLRLLTELTENCFINTHD